MMRLGLLAVLVVVIVAPATMAGVYSPAEPPYWPTLTYKVFENQLITLRQLTNPDAKFPRRNRANLAVSLAAQGRGAALTVQDRHMLGAYLLELGKPDEAVAVLRPAATKAQRNYLLLATLATAEFLSGQQKGDLDLIRHAQDDLSGALEMFPSTWDAVPKETQTALQQLGWHDGTPAALRKAETYLLKIMRLRSRQLAAPKAKGPGFPAEWDALFDDGGKPPQPVRFVGEGGQYQPGKGGLAGREAKKLPQDALLIVQQLLLWMPNDDRLEWLLAELFNVQGDIEGATLLYRDIAKRNYFKVVPKADREWAELVAQERLKQWDKEVDPPKLFAEHWNALEPAYSEQKARAIAQMENETPTEPQPPNPAVAAPPPPDLRMLLVGMVVGAAVSLFAYWQLREVRRRWQLRQARTREAA